MYLHPSSLAPTAPRTSGLKLGTQRVAGTGALATPVPSGPTGPDGGFTQLDESGTKPLMAGDADSLGWPHREGGQEGGVGSP